MPAKATNGARALYGRRCGLGRGEDGSASKGVRPGDGGGQPVSVMVVLSGHDAGEIPSGGACACGSGCQWLLGEKKIDLWLLKRGQ
jgi:hypothetical protein